VLDHRLSRNGGEVIHREVNVQVRPRFRDHLP
jgi:hypothetical protein